MDDDFREFVLSWLERRGWSQARLAEATEISQSLISKHLIEDPRRRVKPSPANLERYAPVLGVPYEDLMRLCGYLPGTPQLPQQQEIEDDVKARTAELLAAVRGAPPVFWAAIIRATFDEALGGVRNKVSLLQSAEGDRSANRVSKTSADRDASGRAIGSSGRRQGRIKPRHPALALAT